MLMYIIRHGETAWNHLHKIQGSADISLDEAGISLARRTGEALKDVKFDLCFSSPLLRARQTAEAVLGERKIPMILDKRIQEIDFGVLEGVVWLDKDGHAISKEMEVFFNDPVHFQKPKGGESLEDVLARTRDFWLEKTNDPQLSDKTILVSSHGCAVRALLQNLYKDPEHFWHGCVPPNCSINLVEVKDKKACFLEEDKVYA